MNPVGRNCPLSESLQELAACGLGLPLAELVEGYGDKASKHDVVKELAMVRRGCRLKDVGQLCEEGGRGASEQRLGRLDA